MDRGTCTHDPSLAMSSITCWSRSGLARCRGCCLPTTVAKPSGYARRKRLVAFRRDSGAALNSTVAPYRPHRRDRLRTHNMASKPGPQPLNWKQVRSALERRNTETDAFKRRKIVSERGHFRLTKGRRQRRLVGNGQALSKTAPRHAGARGGTLSSETEREMRPVVDAGGIHEASFTWSDVGTVTEATPGQLARPAIWLTIVDQDGPRGDVIDVDHVGPAHRAD